MRALLKRSMPIDRLCASWRVSLRAENIAGLLAECCAPSEPNLLVIDIDGNDYWVLAEIFRSYRPRVVVSEYNGRWPPPLEWIMPYNPTHTWDYSAYFGASLASLAKLARRHDYELVACESMGVNAFFVRGDLPGCICRTKSVTPVTTTRRRATPAGSATRFGPAIRANR